MTRWVTRAGTVVLPVVLALAGAGCSSSGKASSTGTTVESSSAATSAPASTAPPPTVQPPGIPTTVSTTKGAPCGGADALLTEIKSSLGNGKLGLRISAFVSAPSDPNWVRATIPPPNPPDPSGELSTGAVVVAHCENGLWQGVDVGTGFVGCNPPVPAAIRAEIGYQCH